MTYTLRRFMGTAEAWMEVLCLLRCRNQNENQTLHSITYTHIKKTFPVHQNTKMCGQHSYYGYTTDEKTPHSSQ